MTTMHQFALFDPPPAAERLQPRVPLRIPNPSGDGWLWYVAGSGRTILSGHPTRPPTPAWQRRVGRGCPWWPRGRVRMKKKPKPLRRPVRRREDVSDLFRYTRELEKYCDALEKLLTEPKQAEIWHESHRDR